MPSLPAHAAAGATPPSPPADGVILRWGDATGGDRADVAGRHQLGRRRQLAGRSVELVEIPDGASPSVVAAQLSSDPRVAVAEPNYRLETFGDPAMEQQWGLDNRGQTVISDPGTPDIDVNAPEAWEITRGDPDVVVAVIDTGVEIGHADLEANTWVNEAEADGLDGVDDDGNGYVDDVHGWDFVNDDASVHDGEPEDFHGTHVAGTVAAAENGRGVVGVAPEGRVMALKAIGPDGGTTAHAVAAINYAAANGARVVNASWGSTGRSQILYETIRDSGLVVAAAAGNARDGEQARDLDVEAVYPAAFDLPNVISVAAVDNDGDLAEWSNHGDVVDLGAPGVAVVSTYPDGRYAYLDGTSMATPHVSGAAALLASHRPDLLAADLAARLTSTVRPLDSLATTTATGGMLDVAAALASPAGDTDEPVQEDEGSTTLESACPEESVPAGLFADVPADSVHATSIDCIAWWEIAAGTSATTFGPGENTTRAQMATFLARVLRSADIQPQTAPRDHFGDDDGSAHESSIDLLAGLGIVTGTADGSYQPTAAVTRAQMATFLVRTYESLTGTALPSGEDVFDDDDGSVHEGAINATHTAGWATGLSDATFDPDGRLRRDQMGSFLKRMLDTLVADGRLTPPGV